MALALLVLLYLGLAAATAALAGWIGRPWTPASPRRGWPRWAPPPSAVLLLSLLPLAFTGRGFLPGTTLAPTGLLAGVPPWAQPDRVAAMRAEAPPNPLLLDPLAQFLPWREAARRDLLFNPAQGSGAALLANGQSAVLYPTEILSRRLPPFRAATFSQAARLLVAAWGMFLLARALLGGGRLPGGGMLPGGGAPPAAAVLLPALAAATAWLGCGFLQVWRLHPHSLVAATVPWVLVALVHLLRTPGPRPAVGLAVAGAVAVAGGHPETLLHALLFGLVLAAAVAWLERDRWGAGGERQGISKGGIAGGVEGNVAATAGLAGESGAVELGAAAAGKAPPSGAKGAGRAVGAEGEGAARPAAARHWRRVLGWGAAAAAMALLLAAPLLLPFVDNLRVSSEWLLRRDVGTVVEVPLPEALERLRPALSLFALGDPRDGSWHGPENLAELAGGSLGAAALLLALLSLAHPERRSRRLAAVLFLAGLLGLAVSIHLPLLSRPFGAVPLLRESLLKRLSLWWALAVPLLVAFGLDSWRRRGGVRVGSSQGPGAGATDSDAAASPSSPLAIFSPFGLATILAAATVVVLALLWAVGLPGSTAAAGTRPLWTWGALAAALLVLLLVPARSRLAAPLLLAVLLLPRVALLGDWVPAVGPEGFYPETLATRFVADRLREAGPVGYRVAGLEGALVPHSAAFFGLEEVRAYDPMTFAPYAGFMALAGEPAHSGWTRLRDPARPALAFLGARFVFEHPSSGRRRGVEVVYLDSGAMVFENPNALPRAFVPPRVEVHATAAEALAAAARIHDFAQRVTVSGLDVGGASAAGGRVLPSGPARVESLVVGPGRLRARVSARAPALLATSQPAIPGWRLHIDGEAATPVRVNGAFLGAVVEEGEHAVEMVYAPRSWTLGLALFVLGLAATGLVWRAGGRRAAV